MKIKAPYYRMLMRLPLRCHLSWCFLFITTTLFAQPVITNFSPAFGPIGTSVTITGTNFSITPSNNMVRFGATRATVTASTSTQLTVKVPTGATYQSISITVNGRTAYSGAPFVVTFPDGGVIDACSFASPLGFGSGSDAWGVALGDLDGDGKTDVGITDYSASSIRIFRNTSTTGTIDANSFAPSVNFGVGLNPYGISMADIDGDGKLDIIASSWSGSIISIFRNTSTIGSLTSSSFSSRLDLATGSAPFNISCQDLDGDGKTDIAVGNAGGGSISIWQNIGNPGSITAGSFNPRLDIAGPSTGLAIADVDLDGKPDLIAGYNLASFIGIARNISSPGTLTTGSFAASVNFGVAAWPEHLVVGDLDADNRPDIVTSSWPGNKISILKNTSTPGTIGAGSFATTVDIDAIDGTTEPRGVSITDFDGDGLPDIGLSNQTGKVSIYKNANTPGSITTASFLPRVNYSPTGNARGMMSGDIDGDGKPDLVVANYGSPSLMVLRNTVSSLAPQTITGFAPSSGASGTIITINGTNFSTTLLNNTVKVDGVPATVIASTSTTINSIVPLGATIGPITVTIGCSTVTSSGSFTVDSNPPPPATQPYYLWAKQMGSTSTDEGNAITVDAAGNVYATGTFVGTVDFDPGDGVFNLTSGGASDIFVSKLDPSGNFIWAKQLGGNSYKQPKGITIDPFGNVLITGFFNNTVDFDPGGATANLTAAGSGTDVFISKLDTDGNYVWAKRFGASLNDIGSAITTDAAGNVFTTGYSAGLVDFDPGTGIFNLPGSGSTDIFVSKLDADGNFVWAKKMGGSSVEHGAAIAVDASGNVFTTGSFGGTADFDPGAGSFTFTSAGSYDMFVSKLDASGNFVWAKQMSGPADTYPLSLALDGSGNIITTGYFSGLVDFDPSTSSFNLTSAGSDDIFVSKLDPSGNFVWAKQIGGSSYDEGRSVTVDASGNSYITGFFMGTVDFDPSTSTSNHTSNGGYDIFVNKLDASGNFVWADHMGGSVSDMGNGIILDASGNLYATGSFGTVSDFGIGTCSFDLSSAGQTDIFVLKLSETPPPSPTLANFSPLSGPAGTLVTINGINFDSKPANNIVMFNDLIANVTTSTATSIVTQVPVGALDGTISVTVGCSTGTSANNFDVTGSCNIPVHERAALTDLYNNTDGANWSDNTNWLSADETTWHGVTVTGCRVTELDLSFNLLNGNLPASISNLTYLEILKLDNNNLSGTLPNTIGSMTALKEINTQNNSLSGQIPASLVNCTALENLHLESNQFSGSIPTFLGSLSNLKSINLGFNGFTGTIPTQLGNLTSLTYLSLASNGLTGNIPVLLGNLTSLDLLDLSRNQLTGTIPAEIGNLVALKSLQLWANNLTGPFTVDIENLINLEELNLSQNQLSGPITANFDGMTKLKILMLNDNQLSGDFPSSISSITTLITVDISQNQFTSIPTIGSYDLSVQNNFLDFGDLEPNVATTVNFQYDPQEKLPPGGTISFTTGGTLTIPFATPGTGNSYQWFRNSEPIAGATSPTLSKPGMLATDIGLYYVQVTSSIVTGITLESLPYQVVTDPCAAITPTIGDLDLSFDPLIEDPPNPVSAIGIQSTGQIIVSTGSTTINGISVDGIVRFNDDGSLDNSFQATNIYSGPGQIIVQPDDKIITTVYDGYISSLSLTRLNDDGSNDPSFTSEINTDYIFGIGLQQDGYILLSYREGSNPISLGRLDPIGAIDGTFTGPQDLPAKVIEVQSDGFILLGGDFAGGIARLDQNGSIDPIFNAYADGEVFDMAIQSNGKIIIVGAFTHVNDIPQRGIARLNSDGSIDNTFNIVGITDPVGSGNHATQVAVEFDGKIIVSGLFDTVNGVDRRNLVRLNSDGTIDCTFDPAGSTDSEISWMLLQPDEKILIAGGFTDFDGNTRNGFARVNNLGTAITITLELGDADVATCEGSTFVFATAATGTTNITYQWQYSFDGNDPFLDISNGGGYSGVTTNSLSINTSGTFGEGRYRCKINGDLAPAVFTKDQGLVIDFTPTAPTTTGSSICSPGVVTLSASGGTNGEYRWYTLATGGTAITGEVNNSYTTPVLSATQTYYVAIDNGSCISSRVPVVATVGSIIPTTLGGSSCGPGTVTLSAFGGTNGQYRWYTLASGGSAIAGETNDTFATPLLSSPTTFYVSVDNGSCEGLRTPALADIQSIPANPIATLSSNCGPGVVIISASGGTNGEYRWYDVATGGVAIPGAVNGSYTTPLLAVSTNYYASINNGLCESARTTVVAQIDLLPVAPITTDGSSCVPAAVVLTASGGTNGQYRWYDVSTGGIAIVGEVNGSFTTPVLSATTTYYASINNGTCESTRTPVLAIIDNAPIAPTTTGGSSCGTAAITLTATGGTNGQYRWYDVPSGGTAFAGEVNTTYLTPSISTTATYYVAINNGTCESTRTVVVAQVNTVPIPPTTTGASGCAPSSVSLSAGGTTNGQYRWYSTATGGTSITGETNSTFVTPALTVTTTFYVSINDGTCESSRTSAVATISNCTPNLPPVIASTSVTTVVNSQVSLNLLSLLSDPDGNIDLTKLRIVSQPLSGAPAFIDASQNLTVDYRNINFSGTDELTIEVCDLAGSCTQQKIIIHVDDDIIIYNGISANGDQQNPIFEIKNIELLESTKNNRVSIFNRWGSKVFEAEDYNNTTRVFTGVNENGNDLPSGTYFYKIEFSSGRETQTGYLTLKR